MDFIPNPLLKVKVAILDLLKGFLIPLLHGVGNKVIWSDHAMGSRRQIQVRTCSEDGLVCPPVFVYVGERMLDEFELEGGVK